MGDSYTDDPNVVMNTEREYILAGRDPSDAGAPLRGLAISGGGIRSASFGLGVLQALVADGVLSKIDYLSTVSGGGYIGSSLTWFLKRGLPNGKAAGTDPESFPFGKGRVGGRSQTEAGRNAILDFIRQHGNYLVPGQGLNLVSLPAVVLRSMIVSLFVYFSLLTVGMVVLIELGFFGPVAIGSSEALSGRLPFLGAAILGGIFGVGSLAFSLASLSSGDSTGSYRARTMAQKAFGMVLTAVAALLLVGSLPLAAASLQSLWAKIAAPGGLASLGGVIGFCQAMQQRREEASQGRRQTALIVFGALALLYGLALGGFALGAGIVGESNRALAVGYVAALAVSALFIGTRVNMNHFGLHRMYRDRLMETFMPDLDSVRENRWGLAKEADRALIETMCVDPKRLPYHLVNTNVVLVNSRESKYRGRGGDSFLLSPLYCGSDATGWRRSTDYMKNGGAGMTLPTAMAISGAAANPNTGVAGAGVTRNRWVSLLMSLLNIRLGYWAPNPRRSGSLPFPPNFIHPGLTSGVFGSGESERSRAVELTDGGHFENLGLYELIRRKLKVIIVSDGACDPKFRFGDLANAVERVRVDFGVTISFDDPEYDLRWLQPGSADAEDRFVNERYGLAKRGFAIGTIHYPDGTTGTLVYCKTTMIPNLPPDVCGYKSDHPEFPDQSTADQFFDENQFEAYRELGYYIGWQMLESNGSADSGGDASDSARAPWI